MSLNQAELLLFRHGYVFEHIQFMAEQIGLYGTVRKRCMSTVINVFTSRAVLDETREVVNVLSSSVRVTLTLIEI